MPSDNPWFPETSSGLGGVDPAIQTIDEMTAAPVAAEAGDETPSFIGTSLSARRLTLAFAFFLASLAILAARAAWLDLWKGEEYRRLAESNRLRIVPIPAERGVVYDRDGALLARNIPDFTLTVTPTDLPREEEARAALIVRLAEAVGLTPVEIEKRLGDYPRNLASPVPVKEHLDYEQAVLLDIQSGAMPGVALSAGTKREYLLSHGARKEPVLSLTHLLGYQGRINEAEYARLKSDGYLPTDSIGKTGVEASYEEELRGIYGKKQIEVDAFGREQNVLAQDEPTQGKDLTLTIDADLQAAAERSLRSSAALNGRRRASAVAMDPKTGEILALVSLPSYDGNVFARGISIKDYRDLTENQDQPLYPRAVSGLFPPGSTIKTIVAAAALAEGVATRGTTVLSTGGIRYGRWFFPDWKAGGHGVTDVIKAIAESVNTFFYAVGGGWERIEGLGPDRLEAWYRKFGLGSRLGLDLPGEGAGFVPDEDWKQRVKDEPWYIGDTYHIAIGQGDMLVTPVQVAAWTSVFANGGDLVKPRVARTIRSDRSVEEIRPELLGKALVPEEAVAAVRQGMRETVLNGSARSLQASPWPIAGKTGTAQWRDGEPTHAWFAGFAPYDDPKIAVAVLIEAGGEGSRAAAPVARDIIEAWLRIIKEPVRGRPVDAATATSIQ
jgi:penicillin-binding protein 2